ncbi:MAG: EMC3/TMCO1 family protein, partial [Conexivisphaerales archaeon]
MQVFESSLIILGVAAASSLISNAFTRAKVDLKASNETMKAYNEFLKEYRQTLKTGDKAKIEKLEKKQKQMQEMTMKVQMDRMKVSLYLLIPFLV